MDSPLPDFTVTIHRLPSHGELACEAARSSLHVVVLGGCVFRSASQHLTALAECSALLVPRPIQGVLTAQAEAPCVVLELGLSGAAGGALLETATEADVRHFDSEFVSRRPVLSLIVGLLRAEVARAEPELPLVRALSASLVTYWARSMEWETRLPEWRKPVGDRRVWKAMTLMQAELPRRWTVETLAKCVGLSRPAFARQFVSNTGLSPLRYLTRCRMEYAAELLRHSDEGLAEVAARVGYDSEFAFNRAFKRHHGLSPGMFRRQSPMAGAVTLCSAA